jgi:predicted RNA methylase
MPTKIKPEILAILDRSLLTKDLLMLPQEKLPRDTYTAVNKVIEAAGGKWNRKRQGHVFDGDAGEAMEQIILTGEVTNKKQELGAFDTPLALATKVVGLAQIAPGMHVLEPNAGIGNLVAEAEEYDANVTAFEIDAQRLDKCKTRCTLTGGIRHSCFLRAVPEPVFDRVVMNPPFAKQADIDHVLHAAKFLKPGGRLVAIMSAGIKFRSNKKALAFREFLEDCIEADIEDLPENSFAESGTGVNSVIVSIIA